MSQEPCCLCVYADNAHCALIPVRDLNGFLLGAQKAFILYESSCRFFQPDTASTWVCAQHRSLSSLWLQICKQPH